jgi:hypothetical protein
MVLSGSRQLSLVRTTFDAIGHPEDRRERRRDTIASPPCPPAVGASTILQWLALGRRG